MAKYNTADIRNVALTGHSRSGKTTLAEAILYKTGAIHEPGKPTATRRKGNSLFGISINPAASLTPSTMCPVIGLSVAVLGNCGFFVSFTCGRKSPTGLPF